ncbi:MAG: cytochrome c3 family protein [Kiloniellaceae bacterium]
MGTRLRRLGPFVICTLLSFPAWAVQDVVNTVHNLSVSGPGPFKSLNIDQVCVFCHTPHNAQPQGPLWNRQMSGQTYIQYGSTTLQAFPGQPTGKSRLCLACHDGTVALGALGNLPPGVINDLQSTFLSGRASLGTDLSDDHPISFPYDTALQAADKELANPLTVGLPLENTELQCTTCHDPHERDIVPFLHRTSLNGELCTSCHVRGGATWDWASSDHATSAATAGAASPWSERKPAWRGNTVAENSCFNCHTPHNAATPPRLIKDQEENTCYLCHDGAVAAKDIQSDSLKPYRHPVETTPNPSHDATLVEDPLRMAFHVECMDCHNPHAARDADPMISFNPGSPSDPKHAIAPNANASIQGVSGIDANGGVKPEIDFQFELCFKCHGVPGRSACGTERCSTARSFDMTRQDGVYNIRDKVISNTPGIVSYHPIEFNDPSNDSEVPSLRVDIPLDQQNSLIYCTDCHNGDASAAAGGAGATGPHGSVYGAILAQEYTLEPIRAYSSKQYELCYKCHDEAAILNDDSGFPHNLHVKKKDKACVNCHDPHGSHRFPHLINFLTNANSGGQILQITGDGGFAEPTWQDDGRFKGSCFLNCHGKRHRPKRY